MEQYFVQILRDISGLTKRVSRLESSSQHSAMYTGKGREITISGGSITPVFDYYIVIPESGIADDLDILAHRDQNVPQAGKKVLLRTDSGNSITIKDGTGNIDLTGAGGDVLLDDPAKSIVLVFDIGLYKWICYSCNA